MFRLYVCGSGLVICFTNLVAIFRLSERVTPENVIDRLRSSGVRLPDRPLSSLKYFPELCSIEQSYICVLQISGLFFSISL